MSGTSSVDVYRRRYRENRRPIKSVAASTTLTQNDNGSLILVTAVATLTLPPVASSSGIEYYVFTTSAATTTVTAPAGTLMAFNNAAATSIAFSAGGEQIGNGLHLFCDGSFWYVFVSLAAETVTPTIS